MKGRDKIKCDYRFHCGEHSAENELPFVHSPFLTKTVRKINYFNYIELLYHITS